MTWVWGILGSLLLPGLFVLWKWRVAHKRRELFNAPAPKTFPNCLVISFLPAPPGQPFEVTKEDTRSPSTLGAASTVPFLTDESGSVKH